MKLQILKIHHKCREATPGCMIFLTIDLDRMEPGRTHANDVKSSCILREEKEQDELHQRVTKKREKSVKEKKKIQQSSWCQA
jgi:hypothetical protein